MKENNYPIKYAILELKEQGGYLYGYEDIIRGYIVEKCYVVESKIKYYRDGDSEVFHKVVFPYQDLTYFKSTLNSDNPSLGKATIPEYDACSQPYPVNIVSDLYDSYDDAKNVARDMNEEFKRGGFRINPASVLSTFVYKESYMEVVKRVADELTICELFELLALSETENMQITNENEDAFKLLRHKKEQ